MFETPNITILSSDGKRVIGVVEINVTQPDKRGHLSKCNFKNDMCLNSGHIDLLHMSQM